jgi:Ion transport protein
MNGIKVLRLIKILRPLRVAKFNPSLRIAIQSMAIAFPGIVDILYIMLLFLFVYAIICVNYFQGLFYNCDMEGFENFDQYRYLISIIKKVDNKWDCLNSGASWKNQFLNFDDIFNSMTSLFVMSNSV